MRLKFHSSSDPSWDKKPCFKASWLSMCPPLVMATLGLHVMVHVAKLELGPQPHMIISILNSCLKLHIVAYPSTTKSQSFFGIYMVISISWGPVLKHFNICRSWLYLSYVLYLKCYWSHTWVITTSQFETLFISNNNPSHDIWRVNHRPSKLVNARVHKKTHLEEGWFLISLQTNAFQLSNIFLTPKCFGVIYYPKSWKMFTYWGGVGGGYILWDWALNMGKSCMVILVIHCKKKKNLWPRIKV